MTCATLNLALSIRENGSTDRNACTWCEFRGHTVLDVGKCREKKSRGGSPGGGECRRKVRGKVQGESLDPVAV